MTEMTMSMTQQGKLLEKASAYREKGLFDRALIAEGMRRTRTLALIMGCIVWSGAALVPLMRIGGYEIFHGPVLYGPVQINPLILLCFTVFAPCLTLKAFDFLDSRAGSDLFHSMPVKRQTLAASFLTSVALWMILIIGISLLISVAGCTVLRSSIRPDTPLFRIFFLQMLAASVLVEMSVFLAMTVTGTLLANIVAALGLIFIPRLLISAAGETLGQLVSMMSTKHLPLLFTNQVNIVTGTTLGILMDQSFYGEAGPLYYAPSIPYTFLLAAVYAAAGCALFVRRPSETAGNPALGERIQFVIRTGIGFLISVPAAMAICTGFQTYDGYSGISEITILLAIFLAAFGSMFVYEYLSAHRLLSLKKLLAGILVILALDAVWIAGCHLIGHVISSEQIETDQIESVTFSDVGYRSPSQLFSDVSGYDQSWWGTRLSGQPMTGEEIRKIVSLRHDQSARETEIRDEVEILDGTQAAKETPAGYSVSYYIETMIRLKEGKEVYRYLTFTGEDLEEIWDTAAAEAGNTMLELPEYYELVSIWTGDWYGEELADIYESYREELRKMNVRDWIRTLEDPTAFGSDVLQLAVTLDGTYLHAALPVTDDFPKTQELLKEKYLKEKTQAAVSETESEESRS